MRFHKFKHFEPLPGNSFLEHPDLKCFVSRRSLFSCKQSLKRLHFLYYYHIILFIIIKRVILLKCIADIAYRHSHLFSFSFLFLSFIVLFNFIHSFYHWMWSSNMISFIVRKYYAHLPDRIMMATICEVGKSRK